MKMRGFWGGFGARFWADFPLDFGRWVDQNARFYGCFVGL